MRDVAQVAALYGVSKGTVLAWVRSGELVAMNVGRRLGSKKPRWRITQAALDEFETGRKVAPPVPRTQRKKRHGDVIQFYA